MAREPKVERVARPLRLTLESDALLRSKAASVGLSLNAGVEQAVQQWTPQTPTRVQNGHGDITPRFKK